MNVFGILCALLLTVGCSPFKAKSLLEDPSSSDRPVYPKLNDTESDEESIAAQSSYQWISLESSEENTLFYELYEAIEEQNLIQIPRTSKSTPMSLTLRMANPSPGQINLNKLDLCSSKPPEELAENDLALELFLTIEEEKILRFQGATDSESLKSGAIVELKSGESLGTLYSIHAKCDSSELCNNVLFVVQERYPPFHFGHHAFLFRRQGYHLVPYVDASLVAASTTRFFDMQELELRSVVTQNKSCSVDDILTPRSTPDAHIHRVESDLSSWLTKQLTFVPRDPSVEIENIAQGKLKIHTDEFRVKAEKIIEDKRFKRSEVVNLSTESIQAVIEAYATIVKDLDDQLANLKVELEPQIQAAQVHLPITEAP